MVCSAQVRFLSRDLQQRSCFKPIFYVWKIFLFYFWRYDIASFDFYLVPVSVEPYLLAGASNFYLSYIVLPSNNDNGCVHSNLLFRRDTNMIFVPCTGVLVVVRFHDRDLQQFRCFKPIFMRKLILIFTLALSNAALASNEYSNYASVMAPAPAPVRHSYSMNANLRAERLDKLSQVLGLLSVVSLTAVYYTNKDAKNMVPYSLPIGLAVGSFIIGGLSK
jgi:hypothetical protein